MIIVIKKMIMIGVLRFDARRINLLRLLSLASGSFDGSFILDNTAGRKKRESTPA